MIESTRPGRVASFCAVLALLLGLAPIWLSSVEMWDGVIGRHALAENDWTTIKRWVLDSNWYLTYGLFLLADALQPLLPPWVFFKLWITLMVIGIAREVRRLGRDVFGISPAVVAWLPALVLSFPVWYVFFSFTPMVGHITSVLLALSGYRFFHRRERWQATLGLILILLSFQLASNCAFLIALEFGRWLLMADRARWNYGRSAILLFLAVAAFVATRVIWRPVGTYVDYNRFLNPLALSTLLSYIKYSALFATWGLLLLPLLPGLVTGWHHRQTGGDSIRTALQGAWRPMSVLAMLALAAAAPYVLVGLGYPLFVIHMPSPSSISAVLAGGSSQAPLSFWYGDWGARHLFLPMIAIVLFAGCCVALIQRTGAPTMAVRNAFMLMILVNLAIGTSGHWKKLERIAQEQGIVKALAAYPAPPAGKVDLIVDAQVGYLGRIYEANDLLLRAYGATRWSALLLPEIPAILAWGEKMRSELEALPPALRSASDRTNLMSGYDWSRNCRTTARLQLADLSVWDVLWRAEHQRTALPAATIRSVSSDCVDADPAWR
ncbi:hypothetical protein [Polaromonas aquatica]|uniref:hypothetical protein n=1 Tax=Polaromonas aquatica TaxID=332657 RepID=UPI003D64D26A